MKIYNIIICIGSLILTQSRPVSSAYWAFDPESCTDQQIAFLNPQIIRATNIARNTGQYLNRGFNLGRWTSSNPNFAQALLGSGWAKYARSVFLGGSIPWSGGVRTLYNTRGLSSLTGRGGWNGIVSIYETGVDSSRCNLVQIPCGVKEDESTTLRRILLKMLTRYKAHLLQCWESRTSDRTIPRSSLEPSGGVSLSRHNTTL